MVKKEGSSHGSQEKMPVSHYALKDLLQSSLLSSPAVSVAGEDPVAEAANLLPHYLETFTDSLVVTMDERPVGLVGGTEILRGVLEHPDSDFFAKTRVKEIMSTKLVVLETGATLGSLLDLWRQTGRAFAIMPNKYRGYSAISARKLLEVAMSCKTNLTLGQVSRGRMITFGREQKIKEIIESMFANRTRKLVLDGTSEFISDRIIIQKISRDLNCLQCAGNFLEMAGAEFALDRAEKADANMALEEGCKLLYGMQSPYILLQKGVVTPWDVITSLDSGNVEYACTT